MLNKEVCRSCRIKAWGDKWSEDLKDAFTWTCPAHTVRPHFGNINETWNPPRECEHKLEHAVASARSSNG